MTSLLEEQLKAVTVVLRETKLRETTRGIETSSRDIAEFREKFPQRSTLLKQTIYNIQKKAIENSSNIHDKFNTKKSFC